MQYANESRYFTTYGELVSVLIRKQVFNDLSVNLTEFPIVAAHENETSAYCFSLTLPLQNWNIEIQN